MKANAVFALACAIAGAAAGPDTYVRVPGGRLVHESCVQRVPSGTRVTPLNSTSVAVHHPDGSSFVHSCGHPQLAAGHGAAWKAYAQYHNSKGMNLYTASWTVPAVRACVRAMGSAPAAVCPRRGAAL